MDVIFFCSGNDKQSNGKFSKGRPLLLWHRHSRYLVIDVVKYLPAIFSQKAKYAIVSLGENDRNQRLDTSIFRENYDSIITAVINNGTKPVLLSLCPSGYSNFQAISYQYNDIIKNIASKYNLDYVDIDTPLTEGGKVMADKYNYDDIHPNDLGHLIIALTILKKAPYLVH